MSGGNEGDIVRKKFCLGKYHDELIEEIKEQRYNSRSEVIRAAVQNLYQNLSEEDEEDIESLKANQNQILDEIDAIHEKLDQRAPNVVQVPEQDPDWPETKEKSQASMGVEEKIVELLLERGPLSMDGISTHIDQDSMSVIKAIKSLEEQDIVYRANGNSDKYQINE